MIYAPDCVTQLSQPWTSFYIDQAVGFPVWMVLH